MAAPKKPKGQANPLLDGGSTSNPSFSSVGETGSNGPFNWNANPDPTSEQIATIRMPILGNGGEDPFGLADIIPDVGKKSTNEEREIGERVQSVARMTKDQKDKLADLLVNAGVMKTVSTGYTTSELQTDLSSALKEASQSGAKSLSDYLENQVQQGVGPSGTGTTQSASTQEEIATNLQTVADDYNLPVSPQFLQKYVAQYEAQGLDATAAAEQFKQDYAVKTAQGLYPGFASQINQNIDTNTLLDPYANIAEHTLGVGPKQINWSSPLWSAALNSGAADPKTGRQGIATLSQFSNAIMSNPAYGYQYTDEAQNAAGSLTASLLKLFGKVPDEALSTSQAGPTPDLSAT